MFKNVCLNLPDQMIVQLDAEAAAAQRSRSFLVREVVQQYLNARSQRVRDTPALAKAPRKTSGNESESSHAV